MNIAYNITAARFEAQFSTDFQGDLAAVKAAKFRCDGPPSWLWWTVKLDALNALRENKPASGLTIDNAAFPYYTRLVEMETANAAARAKFAPIKEKQVKAKKERKKREDKERTYTTVVIPEKGYIGVEDLSPQPPSEKPYIPPAPPETRCFMCQQPTYFYELPDLCLYCEKTA